MTTNTKKAPKTDWMDGTRFDVDTLTDWVLTDFCIKQYEHNGWDFIVETVEKDQVKATIERSKGRTRFGAVQAIKRAFHPDLLNEQRQEAINA